MLKSFRFLWQFSRENLAALMGVAFIVSAGGMLTNIGALEYIGIGNLFSAYYGGFSLITLMVLFIVSAAMCTANLNMALAFGARRRDYFWGVQLQVAVYVLFAWLVRTVMCALPELLGWSIAPRYETMLSLGGMSHMAFVLAAAATVTLGCLAGIVSVKNRTWGAVCVVGSLLLGLGAVVLLLISGNHGSIHLWGDLPAILFGVMAAAFAASEVVIWRVIQRCCVR